MSSQRLRVIGDWLELVSCPMHLRETDQDAFYLDRDGEIEKGGEVAAWLEWARQQADRMDPFMPDPPSLLDEEI